MPYVYILRCADGSYYTGSTFDLEKRIAEHNLGIGANYTKKRLPVEIAYIEECKYIKEAFQREKQIQNWGHGKKTALIEKNQSKLKILSECRNNSHSKNKPGKEAMV